MPAVTFSLHPKRGNLTSHWKESENGAASWGSFSCCWPLCGPARGSPHLNQIKRGRYPPQLSAGQDANKWLLKISLCFSLSFARERWDEAHTHTHPPPWALELSTESLSSLCREGKNIMGRATRTGGGGGRRRSYGVRSMWSNFPRVGKTVVRESSHIGWCWGCSVLSNFTFLLQVWTHQSFVKNNFQSLGVPSE